DLFGDGRDRVLVGIAARRDRAPHHILVEAGRRLAGGEGGLIALHVPIAAAVRRMDLVAERDPSVGCEAELVFGVDQDEAACRRDLLAARKEGKGGARYLG